MSQPTQNLVITCTDHAYWPIITDWIKSELGSAELICLSGGSKAITTSKTQEVLLEEITNAQKRYGVTTVWIVDHHDCHAFEKPKDDDAEMAAHDREQEKARTMLENMFPEDKFPEFKVKVAFAMPDEIIE